MTSAKCSCSPWELADIPATIRAIAAELPSGFASNATYAAVTTLDDDAVVGVRQLPTGQISDGRWESERIKDLHDAYADMIGELSGPRPPDRVAHIVRCRPGRAVFGMEDYAWASAIRYALNLIDTYTGEIIVLTPFGWTCGPRLAGAMTPTLHELAPDEYV
jgi:hypothetical protein